MKLMLIFLGFLLINQREISAVSRCNRTPDDVLRPKNADGLKYTIELNDDPESYVAGETYTVTLRSNPIIGGKHMFKEFMLSVEPENIEKMFELGPTRVGYLRLANKQLSKFSGLCQNTITQTNSVSKDFIEVYWVAPPTGSGCVAFRATVVESKESWFSEDGLLTKVLCEEVSENEDMQPEVLENCNACDEAKYELVFEGLWTRNTHPKDYPSNIWYTKFGDIVGSSHGNDQSFWKYDDHASDNLKMLGERGDTRGLEKELKEKMGKSVRTIIKANGLRYPNITGKTFAFFRVDAKNHLISIVTKITPSPDWILGVSSFELCHEDGTWAEQRALNLYPWDIGTDDGLSYNSPDEPASEPKTIQKITTDSADSPFYDPEGKEMKPFAKLYLTRLKTYKKECVISEATTSEPSDDSTTDAEESCPTTPYSDWSPCSVTCGKGSRFQQREFLNPEDEEECKEAKPLKKFDECDMGKCIIPADDPRCELTDWSEWSSCTSECGSGIRTRDKKLKNPQFSDECENHRPEILQENGPCDPKTEPCENELEDPKCEDFGWNFWSLCNVTCGEGFKKRIRSPKEGEEKEIEELRCKFEQEVTCYEPACAEEGDSDNNIGGMDVFNQVTTEIYSQPYGPVQNCKVSEWSSWGPCEIKNGQCGRGYTSQHRQILQHQMNGGKPCPRKLMRKKRCSISCHPERTEEPPTRSTTVENISTPEPSKSPVDEPIDCIMSEWSQWSPCSFNCGDSAVQQRTRSIRVYPKNNGKPCESRLDERPCPLPLACSDKGVPIL